MPAVVRTADDRDTLLLGLVENVARENLTPIEEARAYAVLADEFSLSLGEIGEKVGRSKPSVSNRLRLLELPDEVLGMLERQLLTEGHARAVLAVPGPRRAQEARAADRPRGDVGASGRARSALGRRPHEGAQAHRPRRPDPRGARDRGGDEAHRPPGPRRLRAGSNSPSPTRRNSRSWSRRWSGPRGSSGRSWIRTRDLRLIRAAL